MRKALFCLLPLVGLSLILAGCATTSGGVEASARTEQSNPPPTYAPYSPQQPVKSPDAPGNKAPGAGYDLAPVAPIAQPDKVTEPVPKDDGVIDWGVGIIRATGKAAVDQTNANHGQARLMAERAATVDAQRKLLEIAKGVRVNGETVVEDMMLASDIVVSQVDGVVKGARQVGLTKFDSTMGVVSVELMMNMYGNDGLADAVRPKTEVPVTPPTDPRAADLLSKYSSIVIQGAGTNGKPSMFPRLYDDKGNLILDTRDIVSQNASFGQGAIQFVDNVSEVLNNPALGKNPLIIKVKEFAGKYLSDYVIPKEQAGILQALSAAAPYLLKIGRFLLTLL